MIITKAVVLAAGKGSRMKSGTSKPMTKVGNKRLIQYSIDALLESGIKEIFIIYSKYSEDVLKLKEIYSNINFIKQENVNGSLSSFNLIDEVCKPPFLQLDCDIIFSQTEFMKMLNSIEYEKSVYGYFAVVSDPTIDNSKYIKLKNNKIIDFDKNGFIDGSVGGMIYLWMQFPIKDATEFYKSNNSLAAFYNQLVKKETIKAMFIKNLFDVDTMEEVTKVEKDLKTILKY